MEPSIEPGADGSASRPGADGTVTMLMTVTVDVDGWASAHGVTTQEAQRELRDRVNASSRAVLAALIEALDGMQILSVGISQH
jgi:hypothetical protein